MRMDIRMSSLRRSARSSFLRASCPPNSASGSPTVGLVRTSVILSSTREEAFESVMVASRGRPVTKSDRAGRTATLRPSKPWLLKRGRTRSTDTARNAWEGQGVGAGVQMGRTSPHSRSRTRTLVRVRRHEPEFTVYVSCYGSTVQGHVEPLGGRERPSPELFGIMS